MQGILPVGFADARFGELISVPVNCVAALKYVQMQGFSAVVFWGLTYSRRLLPAVDWSRLIARSAGSIFRDIFLLAAYKKYFYCE